MRTDLSDVIIEQQLEIAELRKDARDATKKAAFIAFWFFILFSFSLLQNLVWVLQNV